MLRRARRSAADRKNATTIDYRLVPADRGIYFCAGLRTSTPSGGTSTKNGQARFVLALLLPLLRTWIFMIISCFC
jgi:hypothetical protein